MKKCNVCKKRASHYWKKRWGERLELCFEHYEDMERVVHQREKQNRLANAVFSVVAGSEFSTQDCPNGKDCKYCKESLVPSEERNKG